MATVEVYTIGGGDYVVNIFNAVAAWTGAGGYKSMIQTVLVMAFAMSTMLVAFNQDWKAWIHWFLQATLMYLCLMVPRMDVQVVDRINPGLPAAHVANVPIGLAMMASFTSQIGDYLVRSSELVFGLPDDLNYSRNGMIYGSRLLEATNGLSINDAEFAANLDEHYRLCVFYDVMLGRKSMEQLKNADDLWAVLGPGSEARSQKFLTRDAGGNVTSDIVSCREAYTRLSDDWNRMLDELAKVFGKQLYPKEVPDLAKAKLFADLPVAYEYLTGVSKDASEIMKQTLAINAMSQAMHSFSGSTGVSSVDVYAQTRAEIQTRNTYNSIAHNAMKWVPILNIVLTVVFYALFPIIFPLFLLPRTGPHALKGYVTGFFYLAAWGPLYVILHMVMMLKSHTDVAGAAAGGVTLASWNGVQAVNADVGILAGYLVASIPFLAAGMARGAMAISGHATSYLNPSQNAAEEAAREASTGNLSFGNTSFDNASYNNRQGNVWASAGSFASGPSQYVARDASGATHTYNAAGNTVTDTSHAISNLPIGASLSSSFEASLGKASSEAQTRSETLATQARQSVSSAATQFSEFRAAATTGNAMEKSYGADDRFAISRAFGDVRSASAGLQERFGLSEAAADEMAREYFVGLNGGASGGLSAGAGGRNSGLPGASVGLDGAANAGIRRNWTSRDGITVSRDGSRIGDFLRSHAERNDWGQHQDSFVRSSGNTSNSRLSSQAAGISSSLTNAREYSNESRRAYEVSQRLEATHSLRDSNGMQIISNLSNDWISFAERERAANPGIYRNFDPRNSLHYSQDRSAISAERDMLLQRFMASYTDEVRTRVEDEMREPSSSGINGPGFGDANGVTAADHTARTSVAAQGLPRGDTDTPSELTDMVEQRRGQVAGQIDRGSQELDSNRNDTQRRVGRGVKRGDLRREIESD